MQHLVKKIQLLLHKWGVRRVRRRKRREPLAYEKDTRKGACW
jgi:hypothetical protein